jgi:DNA-binding LacI/PurR family transcriptional regulator
MQKAKYISICEQLEKAILDGVYENRLPGLYVLAEKYGTSHITISKALRLLEEKGFVSVNSTRGTFISETANFRKHRLIVVIGMSNNSRKEIEAIEKEAGKWRYDVICISNSNGIHKLLENTPEFLSKFPADGYIFAHSLLTSQTATELRRNGINFISMNQVTKPVGISWVDYNWKRNLEKTIDEIQARGHKRIAYIEFKNPHYQYSERMYKLYKTIMTKLGHFEEEYFFSPASQDEYYRKYGENCYTQFVEDAVWWLLRLRERPTAIIISGGYIAEQVVIKLKEHGIAVPGDISIVTYSDKLKEKLAGLYLDSEKRATKVAEILMCQLKYQKNEVVQEFIECKFVDGPTLSSMASTNNKKSLNNSIKKQKGEKNIETLSIL